MSDTEAWHKSQYARVLLELEMPGPAWEDLDEETRVRLRAEFSDHNRFMHDLSEAIRTGGSLPDPLRKGKLN